MTKVTFQTNAYRASHGRQPRGFGGWAFSFGQNDTRFTPRAMSYSEAKA